MAAAVRLVVACLLVVGLAACTNDQPVTAQATVDRAAMRAEASPQAPDMVDLTVYYRHGRGADAFLSRVIREVPMAAADPRKAMELLLEGPQPDDPQRLHPPLPPTTQLRSFDVHKGTANVTLSHHAVSDAADVGRRPEHEALALAAVANSLTEFPTVERVRLSVEGGSGREFWGFWGLPRLLVRDESVIEPQQPQQWPRPGKFSEKRQTVGEKQRRRSPTIAAVRVQPRATYTRVSVEVNSPDGSDLAGTVPVSVARRDDRGRLRLHVQGRPARAVAGGVARRAEDPSLKGARVAVRGKPHRVVITLRPREPKEFLLHTLSEPARVVLDIKR